MEERSKSEGRRLVALLPMKGHSERVPNKNLRLFCGRPLFHRILETLHDCPCVAEIVIDTDSRAIAEDALRNFPTVKILERPAHLRGDFVPMNEIIGHDLSQLPGEHFLQTHSTNPLLGAETIARAADLYWEKVGEFDSLFTVTRIQSRLYWADGRPINHNPAELLRTQDLPSVFEENSNLYFFSKTSFRNAGNRRIGLKPQMLEMEKLESLDIDEETDFLLSELLYRASQESLAHETQREN